MICTEKKEIDEKSKYCVVQGATESYTKLAKVPEWLKNTAWTVGEPYDKDESTIRMYEDNLYIMITIPRETSKAASGLVEFNINSKDAVEIMEESPGSDKYSFSYATGMNKELWISFIVDNDIKAGRLDFSDASFGKTSFMITKSP